MDGLNGPKGNNFDENYGAKSMAYNTMRANNRFTQQKADWQVTRLAVMHGLHSGAVYGGTLGLGMAIYYRRLAYIPKCAAALGIPYATVLAWSTIYRMDI